MSGPGTSHLQMRGVAIAVVAAAGVAGLSGACFFDTETRLCEASGRRCAPGQVCAARQDACVPIGGCGDGIVSTERGEVCDDGNILGGDGCSPDCGSSETCGNGILDPGESCDDGRNDDGDGCSAACVVAACGNGSVDLTEDCDPGTPGAETRGCDRDCTFVECGDGVRNAAAGEACDSSGAIDQTCNGPLCTLPVCGDHFFNPAAGEQCDTGQDDTPACNGTRNGSASAHCKVPRCGDFYTNKRFAPSENGHTEQCDEGARDVKMCDRDCTFPVCGDGHVNAAAGEQCEAGAMDTSSCDFDCTDRVCGDGYKNVVAGEQCDDGNASDADACVNVAGICRNATCGDGFVQVGVEECDVGVRCSGQVICQSNCKCPK